MKSIHGSRDKAEPERGCVQATKLIPAHWKSSIEQLREDVNDAVDHWLSKFRECEPEKMSSCPSRRFDSLTQSIELDENDDELLVRVALPWLEKRDFKVEITKERLLIRSGNNRSSKRHGPGYSQYEEISTTFTQALSLPCEIDHHRVKAN